MNALGTSVRTLVTTITTIYVAGAGVLVSTTASNVAFKADVPEGALVNADVMVLVGSVLLAGLALAAFVFARLWNDEIVAIQAYLKLEHEQTAEPRYFKTRLKSPYLANRMRLGTFAVEALFLVLFSGGLAGVVFVSVCRFLHTPVGFSVCWSAGCMILTAAAAVVLARAHAQAEPQKVEAEWQMATDSPEA